MTDYYYEPNRASLQAGDLLSFPIPGDCDEDIIDVYAIVLVAGPTFDDVRILVDNGRVVHGLLGYMTLIQRLGDK